MPAQCRVHLLLQRTLQDGLLAHGTVAARRPARLQPLLDALAVEDVAARQHRARAVVVVAGDADGAQHELVEPGGELFPGRLATHGQRFRDLERLGSQLAHGSKLRVRSLQGKRLGATNDLVVDAPCHVPPSRQVELPLLKAGQLVERCAARRQRELAKLERGQERERDLQLLLPVLHLRLDHAVGAVRVLPTFRRSHNGGLARGASVAPPFLLLPDRAEHRAEQAGAEDGGHGDDAV
mmetsp:Transcript_77482/g.187191  ORF Transcript_77482/g.187191 Transcript_77482/m.187191 type:complete len:238 (-) Transcript_77482:1112-1825(-)